MIAQKKSFEGLVNLKLLMVSVFIITSCSGEDPLTEDRYVQPIEGAWVSESGEVLSITSTAESQFPQADFPVSVAIINSQNDCPAINDELKGQIKNRALTVFSETSPQSECFSGEFTDLVTFEVRSPTVNTYTNSRVDVDFESGLWTSSHGSALTLIIDQPNSVDNDNNQENLNGCLYTSEAGPGTGFTGPIDGFNTQTRRNPTAALIKSNADNSVLFTDLEFIHLNKLEVTDRNGVEHVLERSTLPVDAECI